MKSMIGQAVRKGLIGLVSFACSLLISLAQTGSLSGKVVDEAGEPVVQAYVTVKKPDGTIVKGAVTGLDGTFMIKGITPGDYIVEIRSAGMPPRTFKVRIEPDVTEYLGTVKLTAAKLPTVDITAKQLFKQDQTVNKRTFDRREIQRVPTRRTVDLAALSAGVFQRSEGSALNIKGGRTSGNVVIIDGGIKLTGASGALLPKNAIEQLSVITGGIPAKYGDATGGIIHITTRGFTTKPTYSVELVTSQFLDPCGYNLLSLAMSGPLIKKTINMEGKEIKVPVLGYFLAGEYNFEKDPRPVFFAYKVRDDIFQQLIQYPLIKHPERGFIKRVETLTMDAFEPIKARKNVQRHRASLSGKLTYKLLGTDILRVDLSGYINYIWRRGYVHRYSLFNWERQPLVITWEGGAVLTISQDFSQLALRKGATEQTGSASRIQNFFYSLQFAYSFTRQREMDYYHRDRIFDYGYIGKFTQYRQPLYFFAYDSVVGAWTNVFFGWIDTLVTFEPGGKNPYLERVTQQYYEESVNPPASIWDLYNAAGIVNGERTFSDFVSYSIWFIPGRQYGGYSKFAYNQYRVWFNAGFDLYFKQAEPEKKGKRRGGLERGIHSIEFGFEYQQDVQRYWSILPPVLWTYMRQYANRHLAELNKDDPILIIDGKQYRWSEYKNMPVSERPEFNPLHDSIYYEPIYNEQLQTWFDKQVRKKLGLPVNSLDYLQIDTLPPEFFSLDMFTPDELFLDGSNTLLFYYGYDYLGNKLPKQYTFRDFWNARDANGNLFRPIPAFRPIYMAFYVQDKFRFRDIIFNIGIRVDRFDANQPVLKDKYLLLPARTAGEVDGSLNPYGAHPSNIGPDYVVYVDDARNPRTIVGYRKGDKWYDAAGNEIDNPQILASQTTTGTIQPYLVNPDITEKDTAFDPSLVFESYKPAWTIMPRLSFAFPISDQANFFAHYDVLTQRPREALLATPFHWYFLREMAVDVVMPNPGLRPEKVIDYEVGFKQAIGSAKRVAISISGFYREFRDMIQVTRVNFAYPIDYMTFDNLDFGTVKGITFALDMLRLPRLNIAGKLSYTLQFAEGTGSSYISQLALVRFGEPNLRAIVPLDYDQRHTLSVMLDYRLGKGKGPRIRIGDRNVPVLENFGVNIYAIAGSGTPFTLQDIATREAMLGVADRSRVIGGINQARKPWTFRVDVKVDKTFVIKRQKEEGKSARPITAQVYLNVFNLLNRKNVINVWRYTGSPTDDGYLSSPQGEQDLAAQLFPDAFRDQYRLYTAYPFNFDMPRRIHLGVLITF